MMVTMSKLTSHKKKGNETKTTFEYFIPLKIDTENLCLSIVCQRIKRVCD